MRRSLAMTVWVASCCTTATVDPEWQMSAPLKSQEVLLSRDDAIRVCIDEEGLSLVREAAGMQKWRTLIQPKTWAGNRVAFFDSSKDPDIGTLVRMRNLAVLVGGGAHTPGATAWAVDLESGRQLWSCEIDMYGVASSRYENTLVVVVIDGFVVAMSTHYCVVIDECGRVVQERRRR
jgi:hypothetical protein